MSENKKQDQKVLPELRPLEAYADLSHYFRKRESLIEWLNIPFRLVSYSVNNLPNGTMYVLWINSWLDGRKIESTTFDSGVGEMLSDLSKNKAFPVDILFYQVPDDKRIYWRGVSPTDIPK